MLFELFYDGKKYLIDLNHFDRGEDKAEIFAIQYSDDDDYEIKMYIDDGENLTPIKVTEQPKGFQDWMAIELQKVMPKSFFANPYFDELMIFYGNTVLQKRKA